MKMVRSPETKPATRTATRTARTRTARTRTARAFIHAAVLGQDVSKSRSPQIHKAAFTALGLAGDYHAISLDTGAFRKTVRRLAAEGYRYLNVTIPHKRRAAALADTASAAVTMTGAANTLVFRRSRAGHVRIHADNTDGQGLLLALGDLGVKITAGTQVVMVGAGGAAAGALLALVARGARVTVLARRLSPARTLARRLPERLRRRARAAQLTAERLAAAVAGADVLVSAVPAAAWADREIVAGLHGLTKKTAVVEMAYGSRTPLGKAVARKTRLYQDGLPMLVHQAAQAIEVALGQHPPAAPLFRAVRKHGKH